MMDKKIDELNEKILAWWQKLPNILNLTIQLLLHDLNKRSGNIIRWA